MQSVFRLIAVIVGAVVPLWIAPALADKRVALVVGNSAYQHTGALPNPKHDAAAITKLLRDIGFTDVTLRLDLDYRGMREAIRTLGDAAREADIALLYFAGHGLEVGGENYLVPVDAKLAREADLEYETITLASLLHAVDGARKLKIAILDACRNNPLGARMVLRSGATRSVSRGLARIEPKGEVLVAYSARAGTTASDGDGRHSPYAEALMTHMATPGLDVIRMFGRVKEAVLKSTDHEQEPWIYGSPGGNAIALVPAKATAHRPDSDSADKLEWSRATTAHRLGAYRAYLKAFPTGEFVQQALLQIVALERLAAQWEAMKVSKDLPRLRSFADETRTTEFGPVAKSRLDQLEAIEAAAWRDTTQKQRLAGYETFLAAWPEGFLAVSAREKIAELRQTAARWEELKLSKDLPTLRSFADEARATEFGPLGRSRLEQLEASEAAAWKDATQKQRLATYQAFLVAWPQGFLAVSAREKISELEAIRGKWLEVKGSEDEAALEAFVFRHGWSEYGAEATASLVALRRAHAKRDADSIKTLAADDMLRLIDNASIVFQGSGEVIEFAAQSMPAWRPRLGKNFLKQMLQEDLAAEGAFASKTSNWSRTMEGLGGIVRSKVDKTGSLFLLQLDGTERSGKDVDSKDRQFKTLQIVSDSFGYVCIATEWHSILAGSKPQRTPERCTINKKK